MKNKSGFRICMKEHNEFIIRYGRFLIEKTSSGKIHFHAFLNREDHWVKFRKEQIEEDFYPYPGDKPVKKEKVIAIMLRAH